MKPIYYDEVKKNIIVLPHLDKTSYPLHYLGLRSELEIKIMQSEIERGTFNIEDWRG